MNIVAKVIAASVILINFSAIAAYSAEQSWLGYLVDEKCANVYKLSAHPLQSVRTHAKSCALNTECNKDGYELYTTDGNWFRLDKKSNPLAMNAINNSISDQGIFVSISGDVQDNRITVKHLVEIMDTPAGTTK